MLRQFLGIAAYVTLNLARGSASLPAQSSEPAECDVLAAQVSAGSAGHNVVERLSGCPVSGPPALARAWQRHTTLTARELSARLWTSVRLRDGRLYPTVRTAAGDPAQPTDTRLVALQVLASYFDSTLAPSSEYLRGAALGSPIPRTTGAPHGPGATPLLAGRAAEIVTTVAALAAGDPDPVVRSAALRLRQGFALVAPGTTPLAPGAIQLVAGCGRRVLLRSTADVDLPVEVIVGSGAVYRQTLPLRGAASGRPVERLLGLPPGPVTALVGGHVVAKLSLRNAPCRPDQTRG